MLHQSDFGMHRPDFGSSGALTSPQFGPHTRSWGPTSNSAHPRSAKIFPTAAISERLELENFLILPYSVCLLVSYDAARSVALNAKAICCEELL